MSDFPPNHKNQLLDYTPNTKYDAPREKKTPRGALISLNPTYYLMKNLSSHYRTYRSSTNYQENLGVLIISIYHTMEIIIFIIQ